MCYICEARKVGSNYRAAQKEIGEAARSLGKPYLRRVCGIDWSKPPAKKMWDAANLKTYAAR